jgi:hypothetical protein
MYQKRFLSNAEMDALWQQKAQSRSADVEAILSGRETVDQVHKRNAAFDGARFFCEVRPAHADPRVEEVRFNGLVGDEITVRGPLRGGTVTW